LFFAIELVLLLVFERGRSELQPSAILPAAICAYQYSLLGWRPARENRLTQRHLRSLCKPAPALVQAVRQ
jgi:hypothetical protein